MIPISEEEISKVIVKCINNFEKIEENLFENEQNLFISEFGEKFHKNVNELIGFVSVINSLVVFINNLKPIGKELTKESNVKVLIKKIKHDMEENPEKKKDQWLSLFSLISEEELIKLLTSVFDSSNDSEETDLLSRAGIVESKLLSHLVSYYILRLYGFMDALIQDLFFFITDSVTDRSIMLRHFEYYKKSNKLNERIRNILLATEENFRLPEVIDTLLKAETGTWYEDKTAFGVILKIRNEIAHGYFLPDIVELKKSFSQISKYANKKLELIINKYLQKMPEVQQFFLQHMPRSFETITSDSEFMMFLIELGRACLRYLSLIEKIVIRYYGKISLHSELIRRIKKKISYLEND